MIMYKSVLIRLLKNIFINRWLVRFYFTQKDLQRIEDAITQSEAQHYAEIQVAIESHIPVQDVFRKKTAKQCAIEAFAKLHVWDTKENSGVLIYLLLTDRSIEIIADRGIHQTLGTSYWEKINSETVEYFKKKQYTDGILHAMEQISLEMKRLFPLDKNKKNDDELSNKVIIL